MFPIAAVSISFLSINYKLFKLGDTASELIDLNIDRITPSDAEILIWLEDSLQDKNHLQQALHKVIENENIQTKYLSYPRKYIENGKSLSLFEQSVAKSLIKYNIFRLLRTADIGKRKYDALSRIFSSRVSHLSRRGHQKYSNECFLLWQLIA